MRHEKLYLDDIVQAADDIRRFLKDVPREAFLQNEVLQSAILQKPTVIGEASARLPRQFRDQHPAIPWDDVVAFRNIAVHAYFAVKWEMVWTTATVNAPALRTMVAEIIAQECKGA